jgi:hypothetical protein
MAKQQNAKTTKKKVKVVQATGGDKGSKKTNDFEASGRDRNVAKGASNPENKGRVGVDDEKVSRRGSTKANVRVVTVKGDSQGKGKAKEKRTTEAGVRDANETKNRSQVAAAPVVAGKKPRKTSKRQQGSRKPGTELTKKETAALKG